MADSSDALTASSSDKSPKEAAADMASTEPTEDVATGESSNRPAEESPSTSAVSEDKKMDACATMFEKIVDYVQGELTDTTANYELLKELNDTAKNEYADMTIIAAKTNEEMAELRQKYEALQGHFSKIDDLTEAVDKLKAAAKQVDEYSKNLETKFRTLDRR